MRHRPPVVGRHRGLPDQHAGAAQRPVQRVDQVHHPAQVALVPDPERARTPTTASPSSAAACSSRIRWSVDRASASSASARSTSPSTITSPAARSSADDLAHHHRRLLAWPPQRRRGHHGRGDQRDRATDQRVGPAGERRARVGHQRAHDDRLHRGLGDEQLPAVEQERRRHRQRHDQRELPPARAELHDEQVADEHAERHPDGHLDDPAQPLAVGGAEADHGRDRREERRRGARTGRRREPGRRRRRARTARSASASSAAARRGPGARCARGSTCGRAVRAPCPRSCHDRHLAQPGLRRARGPGPASGRPRSRYQMRSAVRQRTRSTRRGVLPALGPAPRTSVGG